ncbi:MAG: integrase core domain-containing protein [Sedimentisphaeraceae bacterium JB056]
MQKSIDYCIEENRVLRELLEQNYGCKRIMLTDKQRRQLAKKGYALGKHILADVTVLFQPSTILGWYRKLIAQKYDSSKSGRKSGRPRVTAEKIENVLRIAKSNPSWGYDKIAGIMAYINLPLSRSTVKRILDDHGIVPEPDFQKRVTWKQFLKSHLDVISATDFFTVELLTKRGLVRCMVLFFIDIGTRKVEIAGVKCNPDGQWMQQIARNITDPFDGFLKDKRYLIHDRDSLYTTRFDEILENSGVEVVETSVCAPNMNAYAERFVQTIKQECLDKMVLTSQKQLEYVIEQFMEHYHHERPHLGLGGKIIAPLPQDKYGEIVEFQRLGGLLKSYRRVKKAA